MVSKLSTRGGADAPYFEARVLLGLGDALERISRNDGLPRNQPKYLTFHEV